MDGLPIVIQLVLSATGLIGTLGGAIISYLTLRHSFDKNAFKVSLEISTGELVTPKPGTTEPNISETMLLFKAINTGERPFTINGVGVSVGKRSGGLWIYLPAGTVNLPHKLEGDSTCDFWTEYKESKKSIKEIVAESNKYRNKVKVRGYITDHLGNKVYSNWMTVEFKETRLTKTRKTMTDWFKAKLKILFP